MPLTRCPQCGRVADGRSCFACGYEWPKGGAAASGPPAASPSLAPPRAPTPQAQPTGSGTGNLGRPMPAPQPSATPSAASARPGTNPFSRPPPQPTGNTGPMQPSPRAATPNPFQPRASGPFSIAPPPNVVAQPQQHPPPSSSSPPPPPAPPPGMGPPPPMASPFGQPPPGLGPPPSFGGAPPASFASAPPAASPFGGQPSFGGPPPQQQPAFGQPPPGMGPPPPLGAGGGFGGFGGLGAVPPPSAPALGALEPPPNDEIVIDTDLEFSVMPDALPPAAPARGAPPRGAPGSPLAPPSPGGNQNVLDSIFDGIDINVPTAAASVSDPAMDAGDFFGADGMGGAPPSAPLPSAGAGAVSDPSLDWPAAPGGELGADLLAAFNAQEPVAGDSSSSGMTGADFDLSSLDLPPAPPPLPPMSSIPTPLPQAVPGLSSSLSAQSSGLPSEFGDVGGDPFTAPTVDGSALTGNILAMRLRALAERLRAEGRTSDADLITEAVAIINLAS